MSEGGLEPCPAARRLVVDVAGLGRATLELLPMTPEKNRGEASDDADPLRVDLNGGTLLRHAAPLFAAAPLDEISIETRS